MQPSLFEAVASLRGDAMNESVQHSTMAANIAKDVLEPLRVLRESTEMVARLVRF